MSDAADPDAAFLAGVVRDLEAGLPSAFAVAPPPSEAALLAAFPELASVVADDLEIPGPHGPVPARRYRPAASVSAAPAASSVPAAGLVWVHGGAYLVGDLAMPEAHWVAASLAARGVPVLSLDYRKAYGGRHHPVPSDDVLAGWRWAADHPDALGVPVERLHLGGASAGANLSAGVTKRLRDGAGPLPASLILAYPMVHAVLPAASPALLADLEGAGIPFEDGVTNAINRQLVGPDGSLDDPYAFPAVGRLDGLPPTFILDSQLDTLRASGEAFAAQLAAAGVPVRREHEPGARHGHLNEPFAGPGPRSLARIAAWLLEPATRPA